MNDLKEKCYIALGNLQNMAIDNTKGSKGVDIYVLDINEYIAYLQSKIDKAIEFIEKENKICYTNKATDHPLKVLGHFMWHTDKLLDILKENK